jgi:bifunctional DNA-binding transcriptional regulator/antitoxin component of YhaV-PrlF toxin-antitoxin module
MPQVRVRDKHQITIPSAIVKAAQIRENDTLFVEYKCGVITLMTAQNAPHPRKSIMDYAGIANGLYGQSATEVNAYLHDERASWSR